MKGKGTHENWWNPILPNFTEFLLFFDDRLLAAGLDGTCCALDAVSGRVLWRQRCPKPVFGGLVTDDALVIIPCVDGSLYAR